jgi:hypothetical protein
MVTFSVLGDFVEIVRAATLAAERRGADFPEQQGRGAWAAPSSLHRQKSSEQVLERQE